MRIGDFSLVQEKKKKSKPDFPDPLIDSTVLSSFIDTQFEHSGREMYNFPLKDFYRVKFPNPPYLPPKNQIGNQMGRLESKPHTV